MGTRSHNYVVYNPQLDEFVRVRKFDSEELGNIVTKIKDLVHTPRIKIGQYVRHVISVCVDEWQQYDYDEVAESLFECVIEIYPLFQIEVACKAINEMEGHQREVEVAGIQMSLKEIQKLETRLNKKLVGQSNAIEECIKSIKLISSGLGRFISLFFIGPTGVGKTELSRLLAQEYLGDAKKLIKINCGEYSHSHEYAKLIGSPPGYVGHNEKGILSEKASESSEWIICFDEIEKGHHKLRDLLLGFLEDGKIMDSQGNDLDFTNSIVVFTSNVGMHGNVGKTTLGFDSHATTYDEVKSNIKKEFKRRFNPEFINRLDSVIFFESLTKEDARAIAKIHLNYLPLRVTQRLISFVVEGGFSPEYGARNIKRFIRNNVAIKIAEKILEDGEKKNYKTVFKKDNIVNVETV